MKFRTCLLAACMVVVPTLAMFSHHIPTAARRSARDCVHGWFTAAFGGAGSLAGAAVVSTVSSSDPAGVGGPVLPSEAGAVPPGPDDAGSAGLPFAPPQSPVQPPPVQPPLPQDLVRQLSELGAVAIDCVALPGVTGRHLASCQVPLDLEGQLHRVFQSEGTGEAAATQRLLDEVTAWKRRILDRAAGMPPPETAPQPAGVRGF